MVLPGWITLNGVVILIDIMLLGFLFHKSGKNRQDRSFILLLVTVLILLAGDSMSRSNPMGLPSARHIISRIGNFIIYGGDPFGYFAALYYIDSWIYATKKRSRRVVYGIVGAYVVWNCVIVLLNELLRTGWLYSYPHGVYTHGPFYVVRGVLNMILCLVVGFYILIRRKEIRTEYKGFVLAFPLIVFFSGMLQVFVGGAGYEYAGTIYACLLLYLSVQNHSLDEDYLTGLLNRKGIDSRIQNRIQRFDGTRGLTVYMVDLDFFKTINDKYGHESGDEALAEMADLLRETFGKTSSIGRYGGDEFLIMNDADSEAEAGDYITKLGSLCDEFNATHLHPYRLAFSAGYATYRKGRFSSVISYIRFLDHRMYEEKIKHHAERNT